MRAPITYTATDPRTALDPGEALSQVEIEPARSTLLS